MLANIDTYETIEGLSCGKGGSRIKDQDLLSIKQFSEITGFSQASLRHYDKIKLFRPIKRGENGYRYYSVRQAVAVNFIKVLNSVKIPIKKTGEVKKRKSPEVVLEVLRKQEYELNKELYRLQQAYAIIHTYSEMIQEGLLADEHEISVRRMDAANIELGPVNDFGSGYFYESFFAFLKRMAGSKVDPAYPAGGFYEDIDSFISAPGKPSRYYALAPAGNDVKEAGLYLVLYARGYYGSLGDVPERLQAYAKEHGLTFAGPVYEMYLHDEITIDDYDNYLIQVSVPVKKQKAR